MNFLDNVVKSSNALLKERLNNPFGKQQQPQQPACPATGEDTPQPAELAGLQDGKQTAQQQQQQQQQPDASAQSAHQSAEPASKSRSGSQDKTNSQFAAIAADAEAVTQKAVKGAKDIGSFLFSMANKAGQTVSQTAKQVKQVVESTSILTDFTREQQEFIREHGGSMQAGQLPWACHEGDPSKTEILREQILSLSSDRRNFVKGPLSEADFNFDPQQCYPIALSLLKEDSNLSKMRFELVPKLVNEDTFWRNYFYRVARLKEMVDKGEDLGGKGWASSRSSSGEGPDEDIGSEEVNHVMDASSGSNQQTLAEAQHSGTINSSQPTRLPEAVAEASEPVGELESLESRKLVAEADDLKSKLKELDLGFLNDPTQDENEKWEEELQRDLQEFELVSGDVSALDEEALDKDIMELNKYSMNK